MSASKAWRVMAGAVAFGLVASTTVGLSGLLVGWALLQALGRGIAYAFGLERTGRVRLEAKSLVMAAGAFTILAPWYRTWWAYALYVLALTAVVAAVTHGLLFLVHELLRVMVSKRASDLFVTAGFPPAFKVDGKMLRVRDTLIFEDLAAMLMIAAPAMAQEAAKPPMASTAASMAPRASLPDRNTSCPSRTGSRDSASTRYAAGAVNSAARKRMALDPTSIPPTRSGNAGGAGDDWASERVRSWTMAARRVRMRGRPRNARTVGRARVIE